MTKKIIALSKFMTFAFLYERAILSQQAMGKKLQGISQELDHKTFPIILHRTCNM